MIEGKTIAHTFEGPYGPWIVFTDGSGIELTGGEDWSGFVNVSADEIASAEADIVAADLSRELMAAKQEAWMMRTCDERAEIRAAWAEAHPPQENMFLPDSYMASLQDVMYTEYNRTAFGEQHKLHGRCPKCGERSCPNAPELPAADDASPYWQGNIFHIPTHKGPKRARKS